MTMRDCYYSAADVELGSSVRRSRVKGDLLSPDEVFAAGHILGDSEGDLSIT